MPRGENAQRACVKCGKKFVVRTNQTLHCSRECRMTLAEKVPCPQCGTLFKRTNAASKFCCVACRAASYVVAAREARKERTHCKRGHEMTEENTHVLRDGKIRCRACQAEAARRYRAEAVET
jgi:hypothetical protein